MIFEIKTTCSKCNNDNDFEESFYSNTALYCKICNTKICNIKPITGYIYLLANPCMPGLVKIGFTKRKVEERVAELNNATGVPEPFVIEAAYNSDEPEKEEKLIHSFFNGHRKSNDREFFQLGIDEALESITKILNRNPKFGRNVKITQNIFKNPPGFAVAQYSFFCNDCGKRFYSKRPTSAFSTIYCPFCNSKNYD